MKKREMVYFVTVSILLASTAFAGMQDDSSCGPLFWVFISFGALVVLAQLIPAVLVIIGFAKGFPIKHKMAEVTKENKA